MQLANVSFTNGTAGEADIFYKIAGRFAGDCMALAANATCPNILGTLLTIDIEINMTRYSYDFTNYLPNSMWVKDESPYRLLQVLDVDGVTMLLVVRDNTGATVDEFRPAG